MQIEGVVLKSWTNAGTPFARMVNRPDPGIAGGDMLFIARLPAGVPTALRPGDQLRMHARFLNRRKQESEDSVGEIHAEPVILVARNQLCKPRSNNGSAESEPHKLAEAA